MFAAEPGLGIWAKDLRQERCLRFTRAGAGTIELRLLDTCSVEDFRPRS
jgi:hypothetical protein